MKFNKFEILISPQRLTRYKASCANDTRKTTRLYRANIRMSQAFLGTLSIFEIVLRNKIDIHYKGHYPATPGGHQWLLASILPGGFLTPHNCARTLNKINEAYSNLAGNYTHDKLVAELSFGTWRFMFAGHQYRAGGNSLLAIFPNLPAAYNQGNVYTKLSNINAIRNRVAHHEPICFAAGNVIGTLYARQHFQDIVDILSWMGINHRELFFGIDGVIKEADYIDRI